MQRRGHGDRNTAKGDSPADIHPFGRNTFCLKVVSDLARRNSWFFECSCFAQMIGVSVSDQDEVRVCTGYTAIRDERVYQDFFRTGEQDAGMAKPGKLHICRW